jgi:hypothetical protein
MGTVRDPLDTVSEGFQRRAHHRSRDSVPRTSRVHKKGLTCSLSCHSANRSGCFEAVGQKPHAGFSPLNMHRLEPPSLVMVSGTIQSLNGHDRGISGLRISDGIFDVGWNSPPPEGLSRVLLTEQYRRSMIQRDGKFPSGNRRDGGAGSSADRAGRVQLSGTSEFYMELDCQLAPSQPGRAELTLLAIISSS